jgi:hypothetical protein
MALEEPSLFAYKNPLGAKNLELRFVYLGAKNLELRFVYSTTVQEPALEFLD